MNTIKKPDSIPAQNHSRFTTNNKFAIVAAALIFCATCHASLSNHHEGLYTKDALTCTLYQVATQYINSEHTKSLLCQDENGFSYELQGLNAELEKQFHLTNSGRLEPAIFSQPRSVGTR